MIAEFNDLANQTNGSVLMRSGNTVILATAVMGRADREGMDYFPLTVDYEERFYAAGEILGSRFMRREGRPSEDAILSGRVIDRTIRPLFDAPAAPRRAGCYHRAFPWRNRPDILAVNAASLALSPRIFPGAVLWARCVL